MSTITETLTVGQRVLAVEYDESTRKPRPDGKSYPAAVVGTEGAYIQVRYDNAALNGGRADIYWASSGWRAWDGCMRWRLQPEAA